MNVRWIKGAMVTAAFVAAVPCVSAQTPEGKKDKPPMPVASGAPAMPAPASEMAALAFFDGKWQCTGEGAMEPGGAMQKMTGTVKVESDLGGFWQSGKVSAQMTGMPGPGFEGKLHTTWDPGAKEYVMFWVDSMGGWAQTRATGWDADKITYTGTSYMGGQKIASRDIFIKKADGSLGHIGEMQVNGQWTKMMDETCRHEAKKKK